MARFNSYVSQYQRINLHTPMVSLLFYHIFLCGMAVFNSYASFPEGILYTLYIYIYTHIGIYTSIQYTYTLVDLPIKNCDFNHDYVQLSEAFATFNGVSTSASANGRTSLDLATGDVKHGDLAGGVLGVLAAPPGRNQPGLGLNIRVI